jgi:hypothetical protein
MCVYAFCAVVRIMQRVAHSSGMLGFVRSARERAVHFNAVSVSVLCRVVSYPATTLLDDNLRPAAPTPAHGGGVVGVSRNQSKSRLIHVGGRGLSARCVAHHHARHTMLAQVVAHLYSGQHASLIQYTVHSTQYAVHSTQRTLRLRPKR